MLIQIFYVLFMLIKKISICNELVNDVSLPMTVVFHFIYFPCQLRIWEVCQQIPGSIDLANADNGEQCSTTSLFACWQHVSVANTEIETMSLVSCQSQSSLPFHARAFVRRCWLHLSVCRDPTIEHRRLLPLINAYPEQRGRWMDNLQIKICDVWPLISICS